MSETSRTHETSLIGEVANLDEAAINELRNDIAHSRRSSLLLGVHPQAIIFPSANSDNMRHITYLADNFMKDYPLQDTMRAKLHEFSTGDEMAGRDALVFYSFRVPPRDLAVASVMAVVRCNNMLEGVDSPHRLPEL